MFENFPKNLYYVGFSSLMAALAIILIPRKAIHKIFGFSLVWGYLGSLFFVKTFDQGLNLFHWEAANPFIFFKSPFLLNLAWVPAIMIYLYFIPKPKHLFYLYVFSFCLVSAGLDEVFNRIGVLTYIFWNPFLRFLVAFLWLYGATWHAQKIGIFEDLEKEKVENLE